ncbi:MAG: VWA domain-containing protein, partial [bacterium]|nr:VWA domain-containing protein [bacterium]
MIQIRIPDTKCGMHPRPLARHDYRGMLVTTFQKFVFIACFCRGLKICLILTLILMVCNFPGYAQATGSSSLQADGIDIILLIDESGSMGGSNVHPGKNDPLNKRNEFLELILKDIVPAAEKGKSFRISIIEFGSRYGSGPQWKVSLTKSAYKIPALRPSESWGHYKDRVKTELSPFFKDRFRGNSDHGEAVRIAKQEIEKLIRTPCLPVPIGQTGVAKRQKIVLLITDGQPYVKTLAQVPLKREIERLVGTFPDEVILLAFGLNNSDDYWFGKGYGAFWQNVTSTTVDLQKRKGDAYFITDHDRIYQEVRFVLKKYIDSPTIVIYG